jgi:hypothetical protein
LFKAFL